MDNEKLTTLDKVGVVAAVIAGVVVLALIFGLIFAWPFKKTPKDFVGLSYGGGIIEGAHFQQVVQPGHGLFFNGWGDRLYLYPVTQRNYIISKDSKQGDLGKADFIEAPAQDRVPVQFEIAVYFKVNLSLVRQFHETIGLKYSAWKTEGWDRMLLDTFRPQIEFAMQREARKYAVADIYANATTLLDIQSNVGAVLKENISKVLGADYFCGPTYTTINPNFCPDFTFVIQSVTVPDGVKTAFQNNRTSEIEIVTKQNEVKQAELEAQAIEKRQKALEQCGQVCVIYEGIKSGKIDFWVIPTGTSLVLPSKAVGP